MLFLLFFLSLIFMLLVLKITNKDFMHPTNIVMFLMTIYIFMCVMLRDKYDIEFNINTVLVFIIFYSIFTIITLFSCNFYKKKIFLNKYDDDIIFYISNYQYIVVIVFQLILIYYNYIYMSNNVNLFFGNYESIFDLIGKFQFMTKFNYDLYLNLSVERPLMLKYLSIPITVISYYILYIFVKNYINKSKINYFSLLSILLFIIYLVMQGSRSPIFRCITFCLVIAYFELRRKNIRIFSLRKVFFYSSLMIIFFILSLGLMGRTKGEGVSIIHYIFLYTGAPILNLNNYLENFISPRSNLFGEQTIKGVYAYLYSVTLNDIYNVKSIISLNSFTTSENNIDTGNVYTTFYMFMYDNGFLGVAIFSTIIACYYIMTYNSIIKNIYDVKDKINFKIFVYAYLFNDLIMLPFSNRFYESVANEYFVKFLFVAFVINMLFLRRKFKIKFR